MTGGPSSSGMEDGAHWIADRVESLRGRYQARLAAHRAELADAAKRLGWTLLVHHTDRSGLRAAAVAGAAPQGRGRRLQG